VLYTKKRGKKRENLSFANAENGTKPTRRGTN